MVLESDNDFVRKTGVHDDVGVLERENDSVGDGVLVLDNCGVGDNEGESEQEGDGVNVGDWAGVSEVEGENVWDNEDQ